ncbi:non-ribosomal peptide synthetase [Spartinivicinus ruber]|uniref:non-ribosomal peptide synthetase n=1 Tax=Spartinivicinus ruber TaxID=2683272 RepID=UPI0013D46F48|nr:non-ribosomal peptide synthetase [Spartinivicinus ruber]
MLTQLQLSSAQYGIWLGQQLNLESAVYNTAEFVEIVGPVQEEVLKQAIHMAWQEAKALRVRIVKQNNTPRQTVQPLTECSVAVIDFSSKDSPELLAEQWMKKHIKESIDLSTDFPCYQVLLKLSAGKYYWYQRIHHVAIDGYGFSLFSKRVADLYTALVTNSNPTSKPFADLERVIEEDKAYRNSAKFLQDQAFWQERMSNLNQVASFSANTASFSLSFIRKTNKLDQQLFSRIESLANHLNVSWADLLMAAFAVLINRHTHQSADIVLGLPVMNRLGSASLRVPCMQMNIIPIRLTIHKDDTFIDVINLVKEEVRLTKRHQKYRYEDMKRDLNLLGGNKRLFGPVINIMPFEADLSFAGIKGITHNLSAGPVEDISLGILTNTIEQGLYINLDANPACYDDQAVQGLLVKYLALIEILIENPSTKVRRHSHTIQFIDGGENAAAQITVIQQFSKVVKQHADKVALVHENNELTYRELNVKAAQIADLIISCCNKSNPLVAIMLPRSLDAISAILGSLMAGAGYLPLDPEGPELRNNEVLNDSEPDLVISYEKYQPTVSYDKNKFVFIDQLAEESVVKLQNSITLLSEIPSSSLAYVIYTSGSTGKPNGVAVSHAALANFITAASQSYGIDHTEVVLQFAPLHFDASVEEIFLTLCNGGTLVLRTEEMINSVQQLLTACELNKITLLDLPTAYWHELTLIATKENLPGTLKTVIIGGEAAQPERLIHWQKSVGNKIRLLNTYGPTEVTVVATFADISNCDITEEPLTIGKPLPGIQAVVLDDQLSPAIGEGELFLLGNSLSDGYLNRPDINERRFIRLDNLPQKPKAYRTGDRAKLSDSGELIYLGRIDDEFKISGYRINPLEIENTLIKQNIIQDAAVVGQILPNGSKRLVAFIVPLQNETKKVTPEKIRQILLKEIPPAVVPSIIEVLKELPKTTSGKIDRKQLKQLYAKIDSKQSVAITTTPLEKKVLNIWSEVLGQTQLSPQDDFFKLGGQSLQTIQIANRLSIELSREVAVMDIFKFPVAADLAAVLESNTEELVTNSFEQMMLEDIQLAEELVPSKLKDAVINPKPNKVLLTGATGFVGAQLLYKLLMNTSADVYCLVRANDQQHAMRRLQAALEQQQLAVQNIEQRVIPVVSDLSKPQLGLSDEEYSFLATECDAIYHNGAVVSVVREYSSLREANVIATKELLKLAASIRTVPFHHISTQAVGAPTKIMDSLPETFIDRHSGLLDGYQQSKWAAEYLVKQAGERGLPVSLYRLGRVTGAETTGFVNSQDFFWRIVHASLPAKAFPSINVAEVWTPVDFVAETISRISLTQGLTTRVFNIALDEKVGLTVLFQWIKEFGFEMKALPLPEWKQQVEKQSTDQDLATMAFFDMRESAVSTKAEPSETEFRIANAQFKQALKQTGLAQPVINKQLLFKYLQYAVNNQLISTPNSDAQRV